MTTPALHLKHILAILLGLALLSACVPRSSAPLAASSPDLQSIRQIALLPVVFNDDPIDHFVQLRTAEEILWQTRRLLQNKRYQVIPEDEPALGHVIPPFAPELSSPAALAALAPETADAIMLVRIDHFLDAGFYGRNDVDGTGSLDIYATAQLVLRHEKRIVWQRQGFGSNANSGLFWRDEITATRDLIDNLLTPLPAAFVETH